MSKNAEETTREYMGDEISELQQEKMQLEIENERLRQEAEKSKPAEKFGIGAIIGIIIVGIIVFGGGYALGHYVFHMSVGLSIVAAPALFILLCLVLVAADWIGLLD